MEAVAGIRSKESEFFFIFVDRKGKSGTIYQLATRWPRPSSRWTACRLERCVMILHYGEHLVVGGVCMTVNLEAEIFEGGLHEAGMIDRVFEIV